MAEIIKEGYILKNKYYAENRCHKCGTVSKVELQELNRGEYGEYFYTCPYCGEQVKVNKNDYYLLDDVMLEDIKFPNDFHCYSEDKYDLSDGKVTEKLRELLHDMRENRNTTDILSHIEDDTLFVIARNDDEERYDVFVGKDFYHCFVDYRGNDYITDIDAIEARKRAKGDFDNSEEDCENESFEE